MAVCGGKPNEPNLTKRAFQKVVRNMFQAIVSGLGMLHVKKKTKKKQRWHAGNAGLSPRLDIFDPSSCDLPIQSYELKTNVK